MAPPPAIKRDATNVIQAPDRTAFRRFDIVQPVYYAFRGAGTLPAALALLPAQASVARPAFHQFWCTQRHEDRHRSLRRPRRPRPIHADATLIVVKALALILSLTAAAAALAQQPLAHKIHLWPGAAPGAVGTEDSDKPCLTVIRLRKSPAVQPPCRLARRRIRLPGERSRRRPDRAMAQFARHSGLCPEYRIAPRYRYPGPRSMRTRHSLRTRARRGLPYLGRPYRHLGFLGGRTFGLHRGDTLYARRRDASDPIERLSSRPDFMILAYPVISFITPYAHLDPAQSSGRPPRPKLVAAFPTKRK